MNDPIFEVVGRDPLIVDKRLTENEIRQALNEIERLSFLVWPSGDGTVRAIENTNYEWHRQKIANERFRTIFKIDRARKVITIIAILLRTSDTYDETVRKLYLEDNA